MLAILSIESFIYYYLLLFYFICVVLVAYELVAFENM